MGQQQLLLLVLGIVIVGLAVVAGINAFDENQKKSNKDALITEGIRVATDAEAWRLKPTQYGGGGGSYGNATLATIIESDRVGEGEANDNTYVSPWGNIAFSGDGSGATFTLTDNNSNAVGTVNATNGNVSFSDGGSGS